MDGVVRVHCPRDAGNLPDTEEAEERQRGEPDEHERTEGPRHLFRPLPLDGEEGHCDDARDNDEDRLRGLLKAGDEQDALDRGEDADRGRDHAVADDERYPDEGQEGDEDDLAAGPEQGNEDLPEHDGPALAAVAEAHGEPGILDGDQEDERPDDQGQDADDIPP